MAQFQRTERGAADPLLEEGTDLFDIEIDEESPDSPEFIINDNGEVEELEDGGIEELPEPEWDENLAEYLDQQQLANLGIELLTNFEVDLNGRADWYDSYKDGLDLIGLKIDKRAMPWKDACGVFHPVLAEAVIRYVSEAALELFPPTGPATYRTIGDESPATRKKAKRVKDELNYLLTQKMPENRDDLEMTLFRQALAGSCFRKIYKDPILRRWRARIVPADNMVLAYGSTNLETSTRYTHIMEATSRNDIRKLQSIGFYRDIDIWSAPSAPGQITEKTDELQGQSKSYELEEDCDLLEMYVDIDLEGFEHKKENGENSGVKLPYIVTLVKETGDILSIYRNYDEDNPFVKACTYFSQWKFSPGFGPYGLGLIHILGGVTDASTSILRQLIDAGTMSNVPSGFKSRNLRIKGDDAPMRPGELRDVDLPPGMLSKSIEWIPTKEPSMVLANLLGTLVDEGRRVGSLSDMKIGDAGGANAPVGTTLALIERHTRPIAAVGARNYISMDTELRMLKKGIAEDGGDYEYPLEGGPFNRQEDFASTNIIPTADPSGSSMSQRIMRLTAVETLASKNPQHYDMPLLHREIAETMEIPNADKIVPLPDEFEPMDPVTENMNVLMIRPVKAFLEQDHEAHIRVHMAAMNDPLIQQIVGQSPNAAAMQAAMSAHIQEHVAMAWRRQMEQELGIALPAPGQPIDPSVEGAMSRAMADAADRVLQRHTAEAQAQVNQQAANDPMIQLRQKELQIKEMDSKVKMMVAQIKSADDAMKTQILAQKERLEAQIALADLELRKIELALQARQASATEEGRKADSETRAKADTARAALDALRLGIETMNQSEDRNERRENSKRTAEAKQAAKNPSRGKRTN